MIKKAEELICFVKDSPSVFHVVKNIGIVLQENNYYELKEEESWKIKPDTGYYVMRNDSSIIAFHTLPEKHTGFQIIASHSDSPSFKIKENPEMDIANSYITLNTEKYGGMIMSSWLDRPLSVAGRIIVKDGNCYIKKLINVDRDLMIIPNVAIHMNREVNDGKKYNAQVDTIPLFSCGNDKLSFRKLIAEVAGVKSENILGSDLFLYNRQVGTILGLNNEFISAPKLDDLQCAYTSLHGFLQSKPTNSMPVLAVFDNEEVGSATKQGADSTFLYDVLTRINLSLGNIQEEYHKTLANSFMLSADNAHAIHPNHLSLSDPTNKPVINKGVVIKHSANQKYTTDAISSAIFKGMLKDAGFDYQDFVNHSNMIGGSTLGNISATNVAINTIDVGLPQLAMHSAYETAGVKDTYDFEKICVEFYSKSIAKTVDGYKFNN